MLLNFVRRLSHPPEHLACQSRELLRCGYYIGAVATARCYLQSELRQAGNASRRRREVAIISDKRTRMFGRLLRHRMINERQFVQISGANMAGGRLLHCDYECNGGTVRAALNGFLAVGQVVKDAKERWLKKKRNA